MLCVRCKEREAESSKRGKGQFCRRCKQEITWIEKYGSLEEKNRITKEATKKTFQERYGLDSSLQLPHVRIANAIAISLKTAEDYAVSIKKSEATLVEKYGSKENSYRLRSEKIKDTFRKKYGVDSSFLIPEVKSKIKQTMTERHGAPIAGACIDIRKKIDATFETKYGGKSPFLSKTVRETWRLNFIKKYGVDHPSKVPEFRKGPKMYLAVDGTCLDSSWEIIVYDFFIRNGISIKKGPVIDYAYGSKCHKTYVDFEVDGIPIEVKGDHLLVGCFDKRKKGTPISVKLEKYIEQNVVIVSATNILHLTKGDKIRGIALEVFTEGNSSKWDVIRSCLHDGGFIDNKRLVLGANSK